jgi:hypothetical protein
MVLENTELNLLYTISHMPFSLRQAFNNSYVVLENSELNLLYIANLHSSDGGGEFFISALLHLTNELLHSSIQLSWNIMADSYFLSYAFSSSINKSLLLAVGIVVNKSLQTKLYMAEKRSPGRLVLPQYRALPIQIF